MTKFGELVENEIEKCRLKNRKINSAHEGYGVLFEEVEEFWAEVMRKPKERDLNNMLMELVQISAVAQRCAEDLGLLKGKT